MKKELERLRKELRKAADKEKAKLLQRFFKTGKGEYAEGDIFLGITVPQQRAIAKQYKNLDLCDVEKLILSKIHEERLTGLFILVMQFEKEKTDEGRKRIVDLYCSLTKYINNWDLVDQSAPRILGMYLLDKKDRRILYTYARSKLLWERRISILACFAFIRNDDCKDTLAISTILLHDEHDLIHKAVGWMLREIGKRNLAIEEAFLQKHARNMPRTMLRYAIERFPEEKRSEYLAAKNA